MKKRKYKKYTDTQMKMIVVATIIFMQILHWIFKYFAYETTVIKAQLTDAVINILKIFAN